MNDEKPSTTHALSDDLTEVVPSRVALPSGYVVDVQAGASEALRVLAPDGRVCVTIELTEKGPAVHIEAAALSVASRGPIALSAQSVELAAEHDLVLRAGGDVKLVAEGKMTSTAFEQDLVATHGDVRIEANDDVRVDGERIRLNSPDLPPLRRSGQLRDILPGASIENGSGVMTGAREEGGAK